MAKFHTSLCAFAVLSVGAAYAQEPISPPIAQANPAAPAAPAVIEPPIQVPGSTPALPAGAPVDPNAPGLPPGNLPTAPGLPPGAARLNDFHGDPIDLGLRT